MGQITEKDIRKLAGKPTAELTASEINNLEEQHYKIDRTKAELARVANAESLALKDDIKTWKQDLKERQAERAKVQEENAALLKEQAEEEENPSKKKEFLDQAEKAIQRAKAQNDADSATVDQRIQAAKDGLQEKHRVREENALREVTPRPAGLAPDHPSRSHEDDEEIERLVANAVEEGEISEGDLAERPRVEEVPAPEAGASDSPEEGR